MTLKELVVIAWGLQSFQVSAGPPWFDSTRYDIVATPEHRSSQPNMNLLMIRSLVEDRFQLRAHQETKELPVYDLVVARKDGRLGPGLIESKDGSCMPFDPSNPAFPSEPGKPRPPMCGRSIVIPRRMSAISVPLGNLTSMLSMLLGRTVVEKTGLAGNFDINLEWTPDEAQAMRVAQDAPPVAPSTGVAPSIFTAIQEQLGLKLEPAKGPVEILVIDHAEKPSEN
jgi:uncharacterized protein (TIGR03435 family)